MFNLMDGTFLIIYVFENYWISFIYCWMSFICTNIADKERFPTGKSKNFKLWEYTGCLQNTL